MAKTDQRVIDALNEILSYELTLINQYWLNYRMLADWGLPGLADKMRAYSLEEMEDADKYVDRILYLGGHPNLQKLGTVLVGESPREIIELAVQREAEAVTNLNGYIALCHEVNDHGTRELFAEALREEEEHLDWFETQLEAIAHVGEQNWLAQFTVGNA
ncbi:bacterioferritin [Nitriliruptoraceae bacterium ZYF776]|nr:bacterioferritin [Profundirhabdus halotolerans]